jgi:O-methyltransferase
MTQTFCGPGIKSVDFLGDPRFMAAYRRGMNSGHVIGRSPGSNEDIHIKWRIHTCCWAAWHACRLAGDFVECGTNTGIMSLAVCEYVDFNRTGKNFFLFDTFAGIPVDQISERERALGRADENAMYPDCWRSRSKTLLPFQGPNSFADVYPIPCHQSRSIRSAISAST